MRIIAGQRRGHKLEGPRDRATRPTSDLVRESMFNILRDVIPGATVYDLFAGTGALGLEALSQGAARAIFLERRRANVAVIQRNIAALRYEDRASVIPADVFTWARGFEPIEPEPVVVFLDPPYREYETRPRRFRELLARLSTTLPTGSTLVVESSRELGAEALPDLDRWDLRRYGGTQVAIRSLDRREEPARDGPTATRIEGSP